MKSLKLLLAIGLIALTGSVSAVPITGSIGFTGDYTHDGSDLSDATTIFITSAAVAGVVDGSFADEGIVAGDLASYSDFTFDPAGAQANIWSVGSFSFDLNIMNVDFQSSNLLALSGTGMIKSTDANLDDTFGEWTFTANSAGSNFTFSSSTAAPEPGIALLLGAGLIGFGVSRKLRKTA